MNIQCPVCHQILEVPFELLDGQHIRCPYCKCKFEFNYRGSKVLPETTHLDRCNEASLSMTRLASLIRVVNARKSMAIGSLIVLVIVAVGTVAICCINAGSAEDDVFVENSTSGFKTDAQQEYDATINRIKGEAIKKMGKKKWDAEVNKSREEMREVERNTYYYIAEDEINYDFSSKATKNGAFGLRWGEKPKNKKYKCPCRVVYKIKNGLFSAMELAYDEKGQLFSVSYVGQQPDMPIPDGMPHNAQMEIVTSYVQSLLPIFQAMIDLAEQLTDQKVQWSRMGDKLAGLTVNEGDDGYFAIVRMDLPPTKNGKRIFCVMRNSR